MRTTNTSDEVDRLVHALAGIPGGRDFEVTARAFPRFWPAGMEAMFEEIGLGFPADQLPDAFTIPPSVEEIHITLHGQLPAAPTPSELMEWAMGAIQTTECGRAWDVRAQVVARGSEIAYDLTVFTRSDSAPIA